MKRIAFVIVVLFVALISYQIQQPLQINEDVETLSTEIKEWMKRGEFVNILGNHVFIITTKGKSSECDGSKTLLMFHGFPTSSMDYRNSLQYLQVYFCKIILIDFVGFGLSDKPPNYSYSIIEHAETALLVWKHLNITSGHLLAHDMGDSVATEILTRRDRGLLPSWAPKILSVTFNNGGMHIEYSQLRISQVLLKLPIVGQLFARLVNYWTYRRQILSVVKGSIHEREIELMWEGSTWKGGSYRAHLLASYLDERWKYQESRWIKSIKRLDIPSHIAWGEFDSVAPKIIAETLSKEIPNTQVSWLPLGHFPMIEDPQLWAKTILQFYQKQQ